VKQRTRRDILIERGGATTGFTKMIHRAFELRDSRSHLSRLLRYVWASPNTLIGLCFVLAARLTGGSIAVVRGVVEVHGGFATAFLRRGLPLIGSGAAMTLGHVILGQDQSCLDHSRAHEHVHVEQYEKWGPFFLPSYGAACLYLWWKGRDPYRDNPFEKEAYDRVP
jgi:hypothetical protein